MKTIPTSNLHVASFEPIPGYILEERIGSGGYGDVWRATAPGGLKKAVKIVHGPLSDSRIDREMKAMERIRTVSHPMLLSIERFEVVDDHLVIVSELADGSVKDRFDECLASGSGIGREELLSYLKDAADALDYLFAEHHLQHLDVKPENLLMVGGRVKVADFGLIKDLADKGMSLVGGLTPLYAPPELFDGEPSGQSDQYSLAVVFQEMLTGTPPFSGRTAAQLASQHLHCEPDVSFLPRHDRAVIAKALSKEPTRRFPSCGSLMSALADAQSVGSPQLRRRCTAQASQHSQESNSAVVHRAARQDSPPKAPRKTVRLGDVEEFPKQAAEVRLAPALRLSGSTGLRPTLFLGVGGAALRVLRRLRTRIGERLAPFTDLPAFGMRFLDVDGDTINAASQPEPGLDPLSIRESLHMSLRGASDYREKSSLLLEWLNRRWLYNIPRSRKTEGIRPLGRLAFVDHYREIADAIKESIDQIMAPEAIAATEAKFREPLLGDSPRVVLIGASSGGASGGCMLDLGFTVRDILQELNYSDEQTVGLLMHGTSRNAASRDLAVANSLCFLNEYAHFTSLEGGYPGEPACGLQERYERRGPFSRCYFISLGSELDTERLNVACDNVAEYAYHTSVSAATRFFDAAREQSPAYSDLPFDELHLRSCGLAYSGGGAQCSSRHVDLVCSALLERWTGGETGQSRKTERDVISIHVAKQFQGRGMTAERAMADVEQTIQSLRASAPVDPFAAMAKAIQETWRGERSPDFKSGLANLESQARQAVPALQLEEDLQPRVEGLVRELQLWITGMMNDPRGRLKAAKDAVAAIRSTCVQFTDRICGTQLQLGERRNQLAVDIAGKPSESPHSRPSAEVQFDVVLSRFAQLCFQEAALENAKQAVEKILAANAEFEREVQGLIAAIGRIGSVFANGESQMPSQEMSEESQRRNEEITNLILQNRVALARELDQYLHAHAFQGQHLRFSKLLLADSDKWESLLQKMRVGAESIVTAGIVRAWTHRLFTSQPSGKGNTGDSPLGECLTRARPKTLNLGGTARLLCAVPFGKSEHLAAWSERVQAVAEQEPNVVLCSDDRVSFCYELEGVPLRNITEALIGVRPDCVKLAERLHSRIDLDWPSIQD